MGHKTLSTLLGTSDKGNVLDGTIKKRKRNRFWL